MRMPSAWREALQVELECARSADVTVVVTGDERRVLEELGLKKRLRHSDDSSDGRAASGAVSTSRPACCSSPTTIIRPTSMPSFGFASA